MRPVQRNEILPIGEYEAIRPRFRARVVEAKKHRRAQLSDIMSVVFENRDSVLLQIQEMLRTERITSEEGIRHEIETYNDLLPGPGQLSMTLFIEIADKEAREARLVGLAGLEDAVYLEVDGDRFQAKGEDRSVEGIARTTALHYLKVDVGEAARQSMKRGGAEVRVRVDHPAYAVSKELAPEVVRAIAADFDEP